MAQNRGLNPEMLEEGLNEVFGEEINKQGFPGTITSSEAFHFETSEKHKEFDEKIENIGRFATKGEGSDISTDTREELGKTTYTHSTFTQGFEITWEDLQDELYGKLRDAAQSLAFAAKDTQEFNRFGTLRNAFTAGSTAGFDAKSLCADDHPTDTGTYDNKETGAFSLANLKTMFKKFNEQIDFKGLAIPDSPTKLIVPPALFAQATEVTKSTLKPGSMDNDLNYISEIFPNLQVEQTTYVGAVHSGSDTAYYLTSPRHKMKVFIREILNQWMKDWKLNRNINTEYLAKYRESIGFSDFIGIQGSDGSN